ncbi:MAG: hypothetical protein ACRDD1_15260, partial [Planctomycetia bacterium]
MAEFYSLEEAAAKLGKSVEQVNEMVQRNLVFPIRGESGLQFRTSEIDRMAGNSDSPDLNSHLDFGDLGGDDDLLDLNADDSELDITDIDDGGGDKAQHSAIHSGIIVRGDLFSNSPTMIGMHGTNPEEEVPVMFGGRNDALSDIGRSKSPLAAAAAELNAPTPLPSSSGEFEVPALSRPSFEEINLDPDSTSGFDGGFDLPPVNESPAGESPTNEPGDDLVV